MDKGEWGNREPHITEGEIKYWARRLPEGRATGMSDEMMKIMNERMFPEAWKNTKVVWIPKSDGKVRPICLLPALGRLFDRTERKAAELGREKSSLFGKTVRLQEWKRHNEGGA